MVALVTVAGGFAAPVGVVASDTGTTTGHAAPAANGHDATADRSTWTGPQVPGAGSLADVAVGPDGGVYGAGHAGDGDAGGVHVRALDAAEDGQARWQVALPDEAPGMASATDLVVGPDGDRVLVAGQARAAYGEMAPFAVALDAGDGEVLWSYAPEVDDSASAVSIAPGPDGEAVYLATWTSEGDRRVTVHALDLAGGHPDWAEDVLLTEQDLQPLSLEVGPDGEHVYALVWQKGEALQTVALDAASGDTAWTVEEKGAFGNGWPLPSDRIAVADGTVVVAAAEGPSSGPRAARAFAYTADQGREAWTATLAGAANDPVALAVDEDRGRVIATVDHRAPGPEAAAQTVAASLDDGSIAWRADAEGLAAPTDLALGPAGEQVYVPGWAEDVSPRTVQEPPRAAAAAHAVDDGSLAWTHEGAEDARLRAAAVHPNASRVLVAQTGEDGSSVRALDTGKAFAAATTPDRDEGQAAPAGEARYPVTVRNAGSFDATFDLRVTGLEDGWTATVEDEDGDAREAIALDAGETRELELVVVPPRNDPAGDSWANLTVEPREDPTRAGTTVTHTEIAPRGGAPAPSAPARLAPPCALADTNGVDEPAVDEAPDLATACQTARFPATVANRTLAIADEAEGSQPADRVPDRGAERAEDARMDRWWTDLGTHVTPAADEPAGPRDFNGTWDNAENWTEGAKHETVHAALLPSGNVLYWTAWPEGFVWDPVRESKVTHAKTNTWLFCSGMANLPGGDVYAPGGTTGIFPFEGAKTAERFDHETRTWSQVANMTFERWYPTALTLGDGDVGVLTGLTHNEENGTFIIEPAKVYEPDEDTYIDAGSRKMPTYSKAYSMPDGEVFITSPAKMSMRWDPDAGTFHNVSEREGPLRIGGGSALLDAATGKVLEFGGASGNGISWDSGATPAVEVFDPETKDWRTVEQMHHPRVWPDAVLLPDGDVLTVGGATEEHDHDHENETHLEALPAETFDPETETWIEGEAPNTPMAYHSTTLLLQDGRILAANQHEMDPQFYEPWYLQVDDRPTVTEAPSSTSYGVPANLLVDDTAGTDELLAIRHGAVTHSLNTEQRRIPLDTVTVPGYPAVRAELPTNPSYAPPGYFLGFAVDDGVPSKAPSFQLADGPLDVPDRPPTALGPPAPSDPAGANVDEIVEAQLAEHERHKGAHHDPAEAGWE